VTNRKAPNSDTTTPEEEFLASARKAVISSALVAAVIALAIGILLFSQITAPMRKLQKATAAIARGDLSCKVDIRGNDEFAQLGDTFNKMTESLSQAEIQRQHLMADVAHELRTPLTAIQGTIEGMQDGILPCDTEQLDALYAETTILNRLIGDLRLLSLAEAKQLKLETLEIDLPELVGQIVERCQPQAKMKDIHLKYQQEIPTLVMQADPDRITQVLNNLITNALRYTPKNGTIEVKVHQASSASPVTITVTDTGDGINPQDLPYVFDRFYRADKSRSRSSGGSGLGLAIVKELVEAHGGNVKAESPAYQDEKTGDFGTRFLISLPHTIQVTQ
jgi:two-component system, OmpR family, sensor histidine kinase BaeS